MDKKKEAMKNALFSGISSTKKDSSDSDEEKKEEKKTEPAPEMNLLDFDSAQPAQPTNLLDTEPTQQSDNLLDMMDSAPQQTS